MGVVHTPDSEYMKELLKWEFDDYRYGEARGLRGPRVYQEYPKMLYKAGRSERTNKIELVDKQIAKDAQEEANLLSRGFTFGPDKAIEAQEAREREVATIAANRAFNDRNLSDAAKREVAAIEDATPDHVAEIPETPVRRRGRPARQTDDFTS